MDGYMASTVENKETNTSPAPGNDAEQNPVSSADSVAVAPPQAEPWLRLAPLVILGGISSIVYYLGFVHPYQLSVFYKRPLLDLAKINGHGAPPANEWA